MNNVPAIPALRQWLEASGLTQHGWALANGLDPSTVSKLLRGLAKPGLELSVKIEEATHGAVRVGMWVENGK